MDNFDNAIVVNFPTIVKARLDNNRRLVECEVSNEAIDSEGDQILQKALLDSASEFLEHGFADIDHIAEIGHRYGIPNPSSYIVGRPTEVKDLGNGRTGVVTEIMRSNNGVVDPTKNKYDEFWLSLQTTPAIKYRASVYGFPIEGMVDDCAEQHCPTGATRYVIRGLKWKSFAFTRNPVNDAITGYTKVISAKSHMEAVLKSMDMPILPVPEMFNTRSLPPRSMDELWGQYERHIAKDCSMSGGASSRMAFKSHFIGCCGLDPEQANILAHALMMMVLDKNKRRT